MTTLSEAYKDTPLNLQHIVPLDFESIQELPDSHAWSSSNEFTLPCSQTDEKSPSVPIVDLKGTNLVEKIGHACENYGVFQIINHGVSSKLLNEVEYQARRLFALPAHQKLKALRSPGGATGYGIARISPFFPKFMWHEGFNMMGSPVDHARELWPIDYDNFCDVMEEYQKKMKSLVYQLLLLVLESLGASQEDMESLFPTYESAESLQLNSYPSCPDPSRAIGLAPHTDSLFLTILNQSDTNGLQIFRDGIGWVPVCPVNDALVVNIGDLLHIFSNGRFPSVYHRAIVNETKHRISMAYFYGPPPESEIAPFAKLPLRKYRSLKVKEYIGIKAKHLDKALSLIRL
ncbi:oxygenase [Lithospermum erythrorhizon]|uniref:gibberellin 3beta-dioxygenase n=1 Tax=Lithospermum erythrorhizon TaxID=34254 RepID=A0AAV3QUK7_LITER